MSSKRAFIIIGSVGAGFIVGGGVVWLLWGRGLRSDIAALRQQIETLRRDLERLQTLLIQRVSANGDEKKEPLRAQTSGPSGSRGGDVVDAASSAEDDDEFEEAYDSENGSLKFNNSLNTISSSDDSSELNSFYAHIEKLFEGSDADKREAFKALSERKQELDKDVNFQWRMAKSTYFVSQLEASTNKERQKELAYQAKEYADYALALDKNCANANKWYAITLGNIGDYEPIKNKIANGYSFKTYIEKAIEINPVDPTSHHLLGRWCFGVYMLSWMERKMAATLFAEPPSATIEDSLANFLEADRLNPGKWKENMLYIAKCYIQMKDYKQAVTWLDKANLIPCNGQDDEKVQAEVAGALKQYSSYRS